MKTYLALIFAACALLFSGCATVVKDVTDNVALVRDSFNSLLPADFNGPVHLSRHDAYVNISIDAKGVHKVDGVWTWSFVHYVRMTSLPILPGTPWKSDVDIQLGQP